MVLRWITSRGTPYCYSRATESCLCGKHLPASLYSCMNRIVPRLVTILLTTGSSFEHFVGRHARVGDSCSPSRVDCTARSSVGNAGTMTTKPKILCLHGKFQSGSIFANKIAGARRKLARAYDMHFLDGPIELDSSDATEDGPFYAWWQRNEPGQYLHVAEAFEHIARQTEGQTFDVVLGFSQGGTLATALALSDTMSSVRAVVTCGAPFVQEAFDEAAKVSAKLEAQHDGRQIPKLHFAGETDTMVPVASTNELCEEGGSGKLVIHEQGHLFPTRAARVNEMIDFLDDAMQMSSQP